MGALIYRHQKYDRNCHWKQTRLKSWQIKTKNAISFGFSSTFSATKQNRNHYKSTFFNSSRPNFTKLDEKQMKLKSWSNEQAETWRGKKNILREKAKGKDGWFNPGPVQWWARHGPSSEAGNSGFGFLHTVNSVIIRRGERFPEYGVGGARYWEHWRFAHQLLRPGFVGTPLWALRNLIEAHRVWARPNQIRILDRF